MINVGIIGFGKMGQIRAKATKESGLGKITHIFDNNIDNLLGCDQYTVADHPNDIISHPDIEAVCICLPNAFNKKYTIEALHAGKHVFCEKPPAFTAEEVLEIRDAEASSGKKLMYGFNHRHHEAVLKMRKLIRSDQYGKVLWMRGRYGKSVDETYFETWRANKDLAGGGILLDQGIHMLDLFLYLGGQFDEVQAMVANLYWHLEGIEDNVFAMLRNSKTGMQASLHSTMTQWRHLFSLEVFLEKGYMTLNGLKTSSGTYGEEILTVAKNRSAIPAATWEDEERTHFEVDHSWTREMLHFFSAVQGDTQIEIGTSSDAYEVMSIIGKIYENERYQKDGLR